MVIGQIYPKFRELIIIASSLAIIPPLMLRAFGVQGIIENLPFVIQTSLVMTFYLHVFFFVNNSLILLNQEQNKFIIQALSDLQIQKKVTTEYQNILESLEMGLAEFKNG